ncbi:ABC transporter permease [Pseudofrankia sp. BMG5.36]|uniref:ABC transporter permease n=1 Tax=Pseudofrankia sp. BMG5.36 TaxID=1834512 RepID=UPI0008DA5F47|nr:ABC transporter permease [Pseudofrankia sp. BMG5.36]OHV42677.1 hypothetical protein BCD48_30600 [Pseudofrankia sp. BMG5.36]
MMRSVSAALAPVWGWLWLDLRRRARSLVVLALLVAVASGTVMAATAGARRGDSAMDRLLARTLPVTVLIIPSQPIVDWAPVRKLPGVAALGEIVSSSSNLRLEGIPEDGVNRVTPADGGLMGTIERPVVLSGRLADPARVDEVVVSPAFLDYNHLKLGDTVTARLFTPAEVDHGGTGEEVTPTGPRQPLRIVGVVRSNVFISEPGGSGDLPRRLVTTEAFTAKYRANLLGSTGEIWAVVRLTVGEAGIPAFQRAFANLTGRDDSSFQNWWRVARQNEKATGFEAGVLLALALAALLAAVVLLGQMVLRYTAASVADLETLRTLGMTSREAVLASAVGPALAAVAGVVAGAGAAVAVSPLFPIGAASYMEPDPGVDADLAVLVGVAGVVVVAMVATAVGSTWFALMAKRAVVPARRSVVAAAAYRLELPVPVVVGIRFALEPGRGRAAVPVRPALVGAVVGVLGVLAALTFRAGAVDAAGNPARFGQVPLAAWVGNDSADFGPTRPVQEAWARDPDVVGVNDTRVGSALVGSASITVFSYAPVGERPLPVVTLSGRMPTGPGEIALAPESAHEAGAKVGDLLTVNAGAPARLRVTGIAFVPENPQNSYAEGAWLTAEGYERVFPDGFFMFHETHLALGPGADVAAVTERLTATIVQVAGAPVIPIGENPIVPGEITQVRNVRVLPLALGVFLGLLAVGATGHALATAARQRRHEVAVLRALGVTRRQSRLIVVTQAITIAIVGLAFGVPLGVALGRMVWRWVAESVPLQYVPPVAVLALALVGPAALLVGTLLATLPARRAARLRAGDVLRAE